MRILIAGGRVIDPANKRDAVLNVLIEDGRIAEVADGPYSMILDQVENGLAIRMALLYLLAGGQASNN